uniref:Glyco_trans_2-like domain-containing protein n=1 Tax=Bursaphelenchus xylophilus TaxID=6326 RepID=A0A1I7SGD9_BURXY
MHSALWYDNNLVTGVPILFSTNINSHSVSVAKWKNNVSNIIDNVIMRGYCCSFQSGRRVMPKTPPAVLKIPPRPWICASDVRYAVHCVVFVAWIIAFEVGSGALPFFFHFFGSEPGDSTGTAVAKEVFDPFERYGATITITMYLLRLMSLLVLPQCLCNMLGLLFFNGFRDKVVLKASPLLAPFVCFRVVTKGDYPELVRDNVRKNLETCYEAGIENFIFEVVSDKPIHLVQGSRVREVNVPPNYSTKTGARYKARALQYCLENEVSILHDDDWVVHLDEETLLSENVVCGILNFVTEGKHPFGQGVITYANHEVVNWLTTLSDSFR